MLYHKLAIGLGSLAILHPVLKLLGSNSEPETVDIEVIKAAQDDEMSTNVYHNGVLFGVWVAGVAISLGRLFSYAICGGTGKNRIDVETQTDPVPKEEKPSQVSEVEEVKEIKVINQTDPEPREEKASLVCEEEEVKEIKVINQESYIKFPTVKEEIEEEPIKVEELGSPPEPIPIEEISKEGKGEGSNIETRPEDKEVKPETKISVYKLPAIKRHHFMILQDGMNVLRQSVQGKFSLEKVTLDGVRNFIFIVAKGTPSQLSELESKVKADFRWLTPVCDPSSKLTGAKPKPNPEPKWVSSPNVNTTSKIPTRSNISPRARSPALRPGLAHKTPNPNNKNQK